MQKTLSALTLLLVCLAAITVAWYFGIYLPGNSGRDSARRCAESAVAFRGDFQRRIESSSAESDRHWLDSDVHFNKKLKACLVEITWDEMANDTLHQVAVVVDLYTNRELIRTHYTTELGDSAPSTPGTRDLDPPAYLTQKQKLFSE